MNIVNIIIILNCIFLLYLFIHFKKKEDFAVILNTNKKNKNKFTNYQNFNSHKLNIKKTHNYNLIYSDKTTNLYVWEAKPIDNYYPIGQIITESNLPPSKASILVKSNGKNTPKSYKLVKVLDNKKYSIWEPIPHDGYGLVSHIFSKTMPPSINKIRMIEKKYLELSSIDTALEEKNIDLYNIQNSDYFISEIINNSQKEIFYIPENNLSPEKNIKIENTLKYKKLWEHKNKDNNKYISIWRPIPDLNYRSLGDIVLNYEDDPNGNLETITVHKDFVKPIVYFYPPVIYNHNDKKKIKFWNAKTHEGYTTLGQVMSFDTEPSSELIYSIPIEYCVKSKLENVWNPIAFNNQKINIWSNNGFLKAVRGFKKHNEVTYKINNIDSFINYNLDELDTNITIDLVFKKVKENINPNILFNLIKKKIALKLDINESRIIIKKIDMKNSKIKIVIHKRNAESLDKLTHKAAEELFDIVSKYNIIIKDKSSILIILNDIVYEKLDDSKNKEKSFQNKISTIKLDNNAWIKNQAT